MRFDSLDPSQGLKSIQFERPLREITAFELADVIPALAEVEREVAAGHHAAGFVAYEAAPAMDAALVVRPPVANLPLLAFTIFADRIEGAPLQGLESVDNDNELGPLDPILDESDYFARGAEILELIAAGDTYQVNFTFPIRGTFSGSEPGLYRDLCLAQKAGFCAFLSVGPFAIISASPELFFRRRGRSIEMRPMKGTRPRGRFGREDVEFAEALLSSPKDRAENLMIVDLLRNDVGRIAEFGSVSVPQLFHVERYPTVHQLTSTVTATLRDDVGLPDIFRALFPSGSVTGAPKIHTSEIIERQEISPRGPYTGAIGFLSGDEAVFNVAIRTLLLDRRSGQAELGVGSGITAGSSLIAEYRECLGKAAFLRHRLPEFDLLESLLLEAPRGYPLFRGHLERLMASAQYFGLVVDVEKVERALEDLKSSVLPGRYKVRLLVDRLGELQLAHETIPETLPPARVALATEPVDSSDIFLFHKTTHRDMYDHALDGTTDLHDVILFNERGELTESTRANLVLEIDGGMVTPPVECGLLGGVLRGKLVSAGKIQERVLKAEDLSRASRIFLVNSVRGWRPAVL